MMVSKKVLVTGGAGFIGSHLCERLVAANCDVLCVDNYFTGTKDNIAQLMDNPRFEVMRHDITFPLYVEVDEIYNLACPASPIHYQFDPVQTTKTSVHGAINMLGLAKRGFQRVRIDGALYDIEDAPALDKKFKHDIEVVVDRLVVRRFQTVKMDRKRQIGARRILLQLLAQQQRVGAEIDELFARDQAGDNLVDFLMQQRFAARDRHHRRAAFRPNDYHRTD